METCSVIEPFNETRDSITNLHLYIEKNNIEPPPDKQSHYNKLINFWFSISIRDDIKGFEDIRHLNFQVAEFFLSNPELESLWLKYKQLFKNLRYIIGQKITFLYEYDGDVTSPITIKRLNPKIIRKQLQCRTYTRQKGLRINPRDLVKEEHITYIEIFEDTHKDDRIQIQFYLDEELIGFVLLTIIPLDIYHPEAYTEEIQRKNSILFNMTTLPDTNSHIPFFPGPTYQLTYIQVNEGFRNKGTGTKMIKNVMRHYTFISQPDSIISDRAFISAGCVSYGTGTYNGGRIFRSK